MNLFDKNIHRGEFRLRILMTDGCNKNCSFCLNDFQPKPEGKAKFIYASDAWSAITAYCAVLQTEKETPIITFSGGEPGIHPSICEILETARRHGAVTKVVTNGTALYLTELKPLVDYWHVSVTGKNEDLVEFLKCNPDYNVQIQHVVLNAVDLYDMHDFFSFYAAVDLPIKLWVNFFDSVEAQKNSMEAIKNIAWKYPEYNITSRFTGKQENRGQACKSCPTEKCVTLKALWVFPDGTASTCPQGYKEKRKPISWKKTMEDAYRAHMATGK